MDPVNMDPSNALSVLPQARRHDRNILLLVVLALAVGVAASIALAVSHGMTLHSLGILGIRDVVVDTLVDCSPWPSVMGIPIRGVANKVVTKVPPLIAMMTLFLLIETFYPARPSQRVLSISLFSDFIWTLAQLSLLLWIASWFLTLLGTFYQRNLSFLTISYVSKLPTALAVALSLIALDFLAWLHHVIRHKVTAFWWFHTIHHSQTNMNAMTDSRYHVVEYFFSSLLTFIPYFMFELGVTTSAIIGIVGASYTRLYHSNIRSNFGILRFILVTPQSHRVHHSILPEHRDKNFGVLLSVWDRLFRTHCPDANVYPETGIEDIDFPVETNWKSALSFRTFLAQNLYPFRLIWRSMRRAEKS